MLPKNNIKIVTLFVITFFITKNLSAQTTSNLAVSNNYQNLNNKNVSINDAFIPAVSFYYITNTGNTNNFTFISTATIEEGSLNYFWDFGDGTTSTFINPTKTFFANGTYHITLKVTSSEGKINSLTQAVKISKSEYLSAFNFNIDPLNFNSIIFSNSSSIGEGVTYEWNFGDGTTSTATHPIHKFNNSGTYIITLTVSAPNLDPVISNQTIVIENNESSTFENTTLLNVGSFTTTYLDASLLNFNIEKFTTSLINNRENNLIATAKTNFETKEINAVITSPTLKNIDLTNSSFYSIKDDNTSGYNIDELGFWETTEFKQTIHTNKYTDYIITTKQQLIGEMDKNTGTFIIQPNEFFIQFMDSKEYKIFKQTFLDTWALLQHKLISFIS